MRASGLSLAGAALAMALGACTTAEPNGARGSNDAQESDVTVDTRNPASRRQYDANVAFAQGYVPRCGATSDPSRPRVLVSGFGRFMSIRDNATGRVVSALVPAAAYPETTAPPRGEVDPPETQLSVASTTLELPGAGEVDVCAMIVPVYWDLAAILVAKEIEAFAPSLVIMNGVAGAMQPLWFELGSSNRAVASDDGSGQLRPLPSEGEHLARLVEGASAEEEARPNLLSWTATITAAQETIERHATTFGATLPGARLAGFPRASSTYLCNNLTYVTGYLMDHPGETVPLLRAEPALTGAVNEIPVTLTRDLRAVPRVFLHWPSRLDAAGHRAGADVLRAIIDAQLTAIGRGDAPTRGDNTTADPTLPGGAFF